MIDPNDAVKEEESVASTEQQTVNQDQVEDTTKTESSAVETTEQEIEETVKTQPQVKDDIDERGVPWKNRAMEAERKLTEFPSYIPKIIEETIAKANNKPQEPKYTKEHIPQLRQYALDNPQYAGWVDQQITDIQLNEQARVVKAEIDNFKQEQINNQVRQQSEQFVTTHPVFKDCFGTDVYGNKVWNMGNPLSQEMANILNAVDSLTGKAVKDRPDGLKVAAEIAFGRTALHSSNQVKSTVQTLKKDLKKAQKATMISGGGKPVSSNNVSPVRKSLENYNKTYNKSDMTTAVKDYLKGTGFIKEE